MLEEAGLIEHREGRYELTPRGIRRIGQNALADLYRKLRQDRPGDHRLDRTGAGHERAYETKAYEYGDPFTLSIEKTVRNAIARQGAGTPVRLSPDDFEIERTEQQTRTATVLMLDLSLSMPMRDNFLPAKKMAMALHSLITSQFPRDYFAIVGFSSVARVLKAEDLPEVSWDYVYGTNMQHGFMLSRQILGRQSGTKQIIMVTDGEPTAHFEPGAVRAVLRVPAGAGDGRGDAARGQPLHPRRHPHQHLRARRHQLPARLRRHAHASSTAAGPSSRRTTRSATTCSTTSSSTVG